MFCPTFKTQELKIKQNDCKELGWLIFKQHASSGHCDF